MSRLKELVESIERFIPGLSSYKEKELLREESLKVRNYITEKVNTILSQLRNAEMRLIMSVPNFDPTLFEEQVVQRLEMLLRKVESAEAGYGGLLDQVNIEEKELEALLEVDLEILKEVGKLEELAKEVDKAVSQGKPLDINVFVQVERKIEELLDRRMKILRTGGGVA